MDREIVHSLLRLFDERIAEDLPREVLRLAADHVAAADGDQHCAVEPFGQLRCHRRCVVGQSPPRGDVGAEKGHAQFAAGFADLDPETLGPNVRANLEIARRISLADRARAHVVQTRIARAFAQALERVDVIVAPVTPVSPFPWTTLYAETVDGQPMANYYRWLALCYGVTLSTHPALSLPSGRDEAGMPFGLQVVGRLRGDVELLSAAQALEQVLATQPETARPRPDLAALAAPQPALRSIVTHPPVYGAAPSSHGLAAPV